MLLVVHPNREVFAGSLNRRQQAYVPSRQPPAADVETKTAYLVEGTPRPPSMIDSMDG